MLMCLTDLYLTHVTFLARPPPPPPELLCSVKWIISSVRFTVRSHVLPAKLLNKFQWMALNIQAEHKRTLHFQNDTENKCGVLRTSHLHQSIEKHSKFCTHLTETRYVLRESRGRCRDDSPARPNFVQCVPSDGSYGSCDSRKWILGWVVPCEIVCEMHVAQLLQTLSSLTAVHTNSSVVG
jgi:hypothetical protein